MEENEIINNNILNLNQSEIDQHIMFSYSWSQKNNVRHIYDIIDEQFPNVPKWIDISKMSGNILEAMNTAVENSFLIIIFLSKDYKSSANCKIESEFICGKQKNYILVLVEKGYPYLETNEKENWLSKMFKNQFYVDLSEGMNFENLSKLKELINDEISKKYVNNSIRKRRPSFTKKNSKNSLYNSPIKTPLKKKSISIDLDNDDELNNFILKNDLDQDNINNIKDLIIKTPRTMIPTLKAGGISFKGILHILNDIKNEDSDSNDNDSPK